MGAAQSQINASVTLVVLALQAPQLLAWDLRIGLIFPSSFGERRQPLPPGVASKRPALQVFDVRPPFNPRGGRGRWALWAIRHTGPRWDTREVQWLKVTEHLQPRNVDKNDLVIAYGDQTLGTQLGKRSIEVGRA